MNERLKQLIEVTSKRAIKTNDNVFDLLKLHGIEEGFKYFNLCCYIMAILNEYKELVIQLIQNGCEIIFKHVFDETEGAVKADAYDSDEYLPIIVDHNGFDYECKLLCDDDRIMRLCLTCGEWRHSKDNIGADDDVNMLSKFVEEVCEEWLSFIDYIEV